MYTDSLERISMKAQRQSAILDVVEHEAVRSQEQLRQRLSSRGFDVTQATLSRDIKELGLLKRSSDGAYQPAGADATVARPARSTRSAARCRNTSSNIEPVQQLVVLKTGAGQAQLLGLAIDRVAPARGRRHARRRRHHSDHRPRREERAGGRQAVEGPRQLKPIVVLAYSGGARSTAAHSVARRSSSRGRRDGDARSRPVRRSRRDPRRTRWPPARRARTSSTRVRSSRATSCCRRSRPARSRMTRYPMATALSRPLIAKTLVQIARDRERDARGAWLPSAAIAARLAQPLNTLNPTLTEIAVARGTRVRRNELTTANGRSRRRQPVGPHDWAPRRRWLARAGRGAVQGDAPPRRGAGQARARRG